MWLWWNAKLNINFWMFWKAKKQQVQYDFNIINYLCTSEVTDIYKWRAMLWNIFNVFQSLFDLIFLYFVVWINVYSMICRFDVLSFYISSYTGIRAQPNICFSKCFYLIHLKYQALFSPQIQQFIKTFIFFLTLIQVMDAGEFSWCFIIWSECWFLAKINICNKIFQE